MKQTKKLLALLLAVLMLCSLLPVAALADDVVLSITGDAKDVFIYFGMDDYRYTDILEDRDLLTDEVDFWEINE